MNKNTKQKTSAPLVINIEAPPAFALVAPTFKQITADVLDGLLMGNPEARVIRNPLGRVIAVVASDVEVQVFAQWWRDEKGEAVTVEVPAVNVPDAVVTDATRG